MRGEKGQVATEYLLMVGILLIIVSGLAGYSLLMYNETVSINQVKNSLNDLQAAVNRIYNLGEGNSVVIKIVLPNGVSEARVEGKAIYMTSAAFGTSSENLVETDADLQGSLPIETGIHYIEVKATMGNVSLSEIS